MHGYDMLEIKGLINVYLSNFYLSAFFKLYVIEIIYNLFYIEN